MAKAILGWGESAPVQFTKQEDTWDFEVVMLPRDDCDGSGCVLASAFFPDAGRHKLFIYPKLLSQPAADQVSTLEHEIGHVFGLRHFFAAIQEKKWASVLFGHQNPFTIMNYGRES